MRFTRSYSRMVATQQRGKQYVGDVSAGSDEDASEVDLPRKRNALQPHFCELTIA